MSVEASGSLPSERSATLRFVGCNCAAISGPRSGCRGTMTVSRSGRAARMRKCAAAMISSSPGWVLAASHTLRLANAASSLRRPGRSTGGGGASALRLPTSSARGTPSWAKRSASPSFWASTRSNAPNSGRLIPGRRRQRLKLDVDMRPLISTSGMARAFVSSTRLGQISDSTSTARSGRQCCKKRCMKPWLSSGMY